jgi:putative hydrolase of the HAD superfamily
MIRAMLWDADGVLQHSPAGWREVLDAAGGEGFAEAVFQSELPALRGEEPLRTALERVLREWPHPLDLDADQLLELWERAVVDEDAMAVVQEVRDRGITCVLATNQQDHRRAWMRDVLGHDVRFDRVYYSSEMGVMKPDPAYFHHIVDDLGLAPHEAGFVDDSHANIEAATAAGLVAVHHDPSGGAAALRREVEGLLAP